MGLYAILFGKPFLLPEGKKIKFKVLREDILTSKTVTLKTFQRFAGKAVSFSIAIAGCKLYLREIFKAIAGLTRKSRVATKLTDPLQSEVEYWRFLDDWTDCLPWKPEKHVAVTLYCDASKRAWGGVLLTDSGKIEARDFWRDESRSINYLEAKALLCALDAFKGRIRNSRVDVHTDSMSLLGTWQSEGGKNSSINDVIKAILRCSQEFNFLIDMQYVPSAENPADAPSRQFSDLAPLLRRRGPVCKECLDHTHSISCRTTVIAAAISLAIVCRISLHATPLNRQASTCSLSSCP